MAQVLLHHCVLGNNEHVLLIRMYRYAGEKLKVHSNDIPSKNIFGYHSNRSIELLRTLVVRVAKGFPLLSSGQYKGTAPLYIVPGSIKIQYDVVITPKLASSTTLKASTMVRRWGCRKR